MQRRTVLSCATAALTLPAMSGAARAQPSGGRSGDLDAAAQQFLALPGTKSYLVRAEGRASSLGRLEYEPRLLLFVGSTFKSFVC